MVFDHDRLPQKEGQAHRQKDGTGKVNDIRLAHQVKQGCPIGLPHDLERQCRIVHPIPRRWGGKDQFNGSSGSRRGGSRQSLGLKHYDGFLAAHIWRKAMRIEQNFHRACF
jgi:hypothetical protein